MCCGGHALHSQKPGRAQDDAFEYLVIVIFEVAGYAETGPEGGSQQPAAGGGPDEGEGREGQLHRACPGALVDHDVDAVVFHRRVEVFLHHGAEPVDFVDEQHVVLLQRCQDSGQVAGLVQHGARCDLEAHAQLVGDDGREGGLPQARGAVEEQMVEGFAAHAGRLHEDAQVLDHFVLAGKVVEAAWAQRPLEVIVGVGTRRVAADVEVFFHNQPQIYAIPVEKPPPLPKSLTRNLRAPF